jgi:hypothetical protein
MKMLISLSASNFKKGDRVAFKVAKDEWYLGTIKSIGIKIKINCDDGDLLTVEQEDFRYIKPLIKNKVSKKPLTNEQAKALCVKPKKVKVAPTQPKVIIDPKIKERADKLKISHEVYLKYADPKAFAKVDIKNRPSMLHYLKQLYDKANRLIFDSKLLPCTVYLMKMQGTKSFKGRGVWYPRERKLGISPRLFIAGEVNVLRTLLHEMSHQAVNDIDKTYETVERGHGPLWKAWMDKCGIPPTRYDIHSDAEDFMTEEEREQRKTMLDKREQAVKGKTLITTVRAGVPVRYYSNKSNTWAKGLIAGFDNNKCVVLLSVGDKIEFSWVTNRGKNYFYELPEDERNNYTTDIWKKTAEKLMLVIAEQKKEKREMREWNKLYRTR